MLDYMVLSVVETFFHLLLKTFVVLCYYIEKIGAKFEGASLFVKACMHNFLYLAIIGALAIPAVVSFIELQLAHRVHVAVLAEPAAADLPRMLPPALLVRAD